MKLTKADIRLRAIEPEDVDFLLELENDESFWHLSNTMLPYSRFDIEQYVMLADKDIYTHRQLRFIVECTAVGRLRAIGAIDLFDFEPHHLRAGIGIMLLEKERGNGFASIAMDILMDYAFKHLGLHQLYCNIESDNIKSAQLFESKGFVLMGEKIDWNRKEEGWMSELFYQHIKKTQD